MSTQPNRFKPTLWLILLSLFLLLAGCTGVAQPSSGSTEETTEETTEEVSAAPIRTVRFTHGGSLCNLALFVAFEHPEWWAEEGLAAESVPSPSINEQIAALNLGLVDFAGAPYTSQIASISQSEGTLKICSGIGV